jgi:hypothetical protein
VVIAFVTAKIFEMQVAADPGEGRFRQRLGSGQVLVKQMAGTPVKAKNIFGHGLIFQLDHIGQKGLIKIGNPLVNAGHGFKKIKMQDIVNYRAMI